MSLMSNFWYYVAQKVRPFADVDMNGKDIVNIGKMETTEISDVQWGALGALVEWTNWTPTLTGDADLSGYDSARYYRIGDLCFFIFSATAKNVTSAGNYIVITLPFTIANNSYGVVSASINDGAGYIGTSTNVLVKNTNTIFVYKTAERGGWAGTETGVEILLHGFFEII